MSYVDFVWGENAYLEVSKYILGWSFLTVLLGARSKYSAIKMEQKLNRAFSI